MKTNQLAGTCHLVPITGIYFTCNAFTEATPYPFPLFLLFSLIYSSDLSLPPPLLLSSLISLLFPAHPHHISPQTHSSGSILLANNDKRPTTSTNKPGLQARPRTRASCRLPLIYRHSSSRSFASIRVDPRKISTARESKGKDNA